jgi:aspartokinase-like uncharacterized kinase
MKKLEMNEMKVVNGGMNKTELVKAIAAKANLTDTGTEEEIAIQNIDQDAAQ